MRTLHKMFGKSMLASICIVGALIIALFPAAVVGVGSFESGFHISQWTGETWEEIHQHKFQVQYSTEAFTVDVVDGKVALRIVQVGTPFADVDQISLMVDGEELMPEYARYTESGQSILEDILELDHNAVIAHEQEIEVSWDVPAGPDSVTLYLTANEYGHGLPFLFPETGYATYEVGSNIGSITVDGLIPETDGTVPLYSPYWQPSSGHPDGYTYIYVCDDEQYVYFSLDITMDNTNESGEDWAEIRILQPDGSEEAFRIDDFDNTWGESGFGLTSKVSYKHQTCEFAIPKSAIDDNSIKFSLAYYGTGAIGGQVQANADVDPLVIEINGDSSSGQVFNVGEAIYVEGYVHSAANASVNATGYLLKTTLSCDLWLNPGGLEHDWDYEANNVTSSGYTQISSEYDDILSFTHTLTTPGVYSITLYSYAAANISYSGSPAMSTNEPAQESLSFTVVTAAAGTELYYDDGTSEALASTIPSGLFAVRFTPTSGASNITQVSFYNPWANSTAPLKVMIFNATGGSVFVSGNYSNWIVGWNTIDLSGASIPIVYGDFYAGLQYQLADSPKVGQDQSAPDIRSYVCTETPYVFANPSESFDFMIRVTVEAAGGFITDPVMVKDIHPSGGSTPSWLTAMGDTLFFQAYDDTHGYELWKSDGTEVGTVIVKDIRPGTEYSWPCYLTVVGSTLFFAADDGTHGTELWKSDGTEAGTAVVKDISPGIYTADVYYLTVVGDEVFFVATNSTNGYELWKSDGTEAGTVMVKDINPGSGGSYPYALVVMGGTLFFTADDGTNGAELWKSDGTEAGTVMVKDIYLGSASSSPDFLTVMGGALFFTAYDASNGGELWKSDGTEAGTVMAKDVNPGVGSSWPSYLTAMGSELFFVANNGTAGDELWKSDGTEAGTVMVKDIYSGSASSSPDFLTVMGGALFFTAYDPGHYWELWKSDGTEAGTVIVKDINPIADSYPSYTAAISGTLFFGADDGTNGTELWKSDGTEAGTVMVKDINPGSGYGDPGSFTLVGATVFFVANDGTNGYELWKMEAPPVDSIVNGSFETGDYTGWALSEFYPNTMYPDDATFGIAANGETISPGDSTWDFYDGLNVTQGSEGLPITYNTTDGDYLAYILVNFVQSCRMYQDITLDASATNLTWDMWYTNHGPSFDPEYQYLAVYLRDTDDNIIETLFKTTQGVDFDSIAMTAFSANISAYAGETVRLDIEQCQYSYYFDSAFDNFAIVGGADPIVNGSFETGNYTGWTLLQWVVPIPAEPEAGTFGIATDGETINYGDSRWDFHDEIYVEQHSDGLPITYGATDGNYLAYILRNQPELFRMYQDVTLGPDASALTWDMWYTNHAGVFNSTAQYLAVTIRDPLDDSIVETLFSTEEGVDPDSLTMTSFSRDISAYAGITVRLDIESAQFNGGLDAAFDNFAIESAITGGKLFMVDGDNSTIYELDPSTGAVVNTIPTPISTDGGGDGLAYGNGRMFFTTVDTNIIYEIDPSDGHIINQLGPLPKVAVYGAEEASWNADVQAKLNSTGLFSQVDVFSANASETLPTPTLSELQEYDAVLVYSDWYFADNDAMGDVLADYIDAGGGVVIATFAFCDSAYAYGIGGRISTDGYLPFTQGTTQGGGTNLTLVADDPEHPILSGVTSFNGGLSSLYNDVTLASEAYLVGNWSDGAPLIAVKQMAEGAGCVVGLNFFPVSSDIGSVFWDSSTDGDLLMANSLVFVASNYQYDIDALGFSGDKLYALEYGENATIRVLNPDTGGTITILRPGIPLVGGLTFAGSRDSLFVSNNGEETPSFGMTNRGFEYADFTGWNVYTGSAGDAWVDMRWESPNGTNYTAVGSGYFALLQNGAENESTYISQNFTVNEGDVIIGWAFFSTGENPIEDPGFNDQCSVDIMDGATLVERVFYADTYDANWPDTPWTYWSWTANSTGTYTLVARVVNIGDSDVSSYMGFDIAETIPSTVYEIDSESGVVLNSFPAPVGIDYGLYGLGFSSARNTLFLGFYESNMIYEVDPDTGEVINAFAGPEGAGISALAADECGVAPSAPKADFHASNTTVCANVTIDFIDDSTGTYDTWYWDFGDGSNSTDENPSHTYAVAGNYTVSLTVSDGYGDDTETKVDYITVLPSPEANFEANITSACAGVTINFTDGSTGMLDAWHWDFGDGSNSTEQNPSHAYASAGNYTVSLTVSNCCCQDTETKIDYIMVLPQPQADFHASNTTVCAGVTINFTDDSTGVLDAWYWDFGDGSNSTEQNPSHAYASAGNYTVILGVENDWCDDVETKIDYITVLPLPEADFHAGDTSPSVNLEIDFFDDSTGTYDSWYWDFGDGSNSTLQNPSHNYTSVGNYTVSLTISNGCGDDTEAKVDYIEVAPLSEANTVTVEAEAEGNSLAVPVHWSWDSKGSTNTTSFGIENVPDGTELSLTAPATHTEDYTFYVFDHWSVGATDYGPGDVDITFEVSEGLTAIAHYTPIIAVDKTLDRCDNGTISYPFDPNALPLKTHIYFGMSITVEGLADGIEGVRVEDGMSADLSPIYTSGPGAQTPTKMGKGKAGGTKCVWILGSMDDGDTDTLYITAWTGTNTKGKQQYVSAGEHTLNSGPRVLFTYGGKHYTLLGPSITVNVVA